MNSGPLSDADVETGTAPFVCVRVDADAREDVVRRWDVRDLPALLWITPEGGVLARSIEIPKAAADITAPMKLAHERFVRLRKFESAAAAEPRSPKRLKVLAEAYYAVQLWDAAAETFDRLLTLGDAEPAASVREVRIYIDLSRGKLTEGLAAARAFEHDFPDHRDVPKIVYWRGLLLHRLGQTAEALAAWREVQERFADRPEAGLAKEAILRAGEK